MTRPDSVGRKLKTARRHLNEALRVSRGVAWAEDDCELLSHSDPELHDPETLRRVHRCPDCGRVASVPEWVKRPVCVHAWDGCSPEVWDGDNTGPESSRRIEESPNEKWRTPGPHTWAEMLPVMLPPPASDPETVERVARIFDPHAFTVDEYHARRSHARRKAGEVLQALGLNTTDDEEAE